MGWKDVPAGKYLATANQARFGESSQKGTLFIEVEFQLKELPEKLIWTGYMTEKTTQRTLDSMALIDWSGDDTFSEGSFSTDKVVQLVVELEAGK